jgi:putative FmdB family regulatory protein
MPIYQYWCGECGQSYELRRGIDESDKELKCPRCGAGAPRRVLSLFSTRSSGGSCAPAGGG